MCNEENPNQRTWIRACVPWKKDMLEQKDNEEQQKNKVKKQDQEDEKPDHTF